MKNSIRLALMTFLMFCGNVLADQRLYKVELIIFAQNLPSSEIFDQTESLIKWPRKLVDRSSYNAVDPSYMSLNDSYARLARSQSYRPLMHVAWIQAVQSNSFGRAVKISNPEGTVNGFFQIQRGSLAYMITDLEYSVDSVIYRLEEKRRFKLNETHYFDHPKFGVVARISPISN